MKVLFLLGNPGIGGGTYVIYQHALKCLLMGNSVTMVTEAKFPKKDLKWHDGAQKLTFKTYEEIKNEEFDVAIATWWRTVYLLPLVKAKSYIYFIQSIESRFTQDKRLQKLIEATYLLPISMITEATWIKDYLFNNYHQNASLVRNGIRKDIYTPNGERYEKNCFRVLIEGPVDVFFKNVPDTINIVKKSKANEIWLLTSSDINNYKNVDRVFSKQNIYECAKIYRSCDVIVKLSYVEGMFGPPLEMFHCGGTAITYNVTGHDEYMKNNYNSLIANIDDRNKVIEYINKLYDDQNYLKKLKENALETAKKWPDWEKSSAEFYKCILKYSKIKSEREKLNSIIKFYDNTYSELSNQKVSFRSRIGNFLRNKLPLIYKVYSKLRKM